MRAAIRALEAEAASLRDAYAQAKADLGNREVPLHSVLTMVEQIEREMVEVDRGILVLVRAEKRGRVR